MEQGLGGPDSATFARSLTALKEQGSNLLVVGTAMEDAHAETCDRLLGEIAQPRRRLFVRTDGTNGCGLKPGHAIGHDNVRVVTQSTQTRSAAAVASGNEPAPTTQVIESDVGALAEATIDAIEELEETAGGFEPAELRVCFDSLLPLLADHDEEHVFRLLHLLTVRVRQVDGMGHYHLPIDPDDRRVKLLEPLFDAVIELQVRDGESKHCWRLLDHDVESGWLPL